MFRGVFFSPATFVTKLLKRVNAKLKVLEFDFSNIIRQAGALGTKLSVCVYGSSQAADFFFIWNHFSDITLSQHTQKHTTWLLLQNCLNHQSGLCLIHIISCRCLARLALQNASAQRFLKNSLCKKRSVCVHIYAASLTTGFCPYRIFFLFVCLFPSQHRPDCQNAAPACDCY